MATNHSSRWLSIASFVYLGVLLCTIDLMFYNTKNSLITEHATLKHSHERFIQKNRHKCEERRRYRYANIIQNVCSLISICILSKSYLRLKFYGLNLHGIFNSIARVKSNCAISVLNKCQWWIDYFYKDWCKEQFLIVSRFTVCHFRDEQLTRKRSFKRHSYTS